MKLMKIDTHTHCLEVSRCAEHTPEELPALFKKAGFDAFVLTNHCFPGHLEYFGHDSRVQIKAYIDTYRAAAKAGREIGIKVFFGCEIRLINVEHTPEFLLFGITENEFERSFPLYTLTQRELFDYCNENRLLMYQAHPFRIEQGHHLADLSYMHGLEVYNGHPRFDPRFYQLRAFAKSCGLGMSAGSDFHYAPQAGNCGMLADASVESSEDLRDYMLECQPRLFSRDGELEL